MSGEFSITGIDWKNHVQIFELIQKSYFDVGSEKNLADRFEQDVTYMVLPSSGSGRT